MPAAHTQQKFPQVPPPPPPRVTRIARLYASDAFLPHYATG